MNKLEFLTRLRSELEKGGMPSDDINDALSYYEEVFLDAGFGKEEETAASMGLPEAVAANILRESGIIAEQKVTYNEDTAPAPEKKKASGTAVALGIILGILTFPIWLPVLIVAVVVLFVLIVVAFALLISVGAIAVGLLIGGVGILFESVAVGITLIGAGLVVTGVTMLICKPIISSLIPGIFNGIKSFGGWVIGLFNRGGKENV